MGLVDDAVDLITGEECVNAGFSRKHVLSFGRPQIRASVVSLSFLVSNPSKETYGEIKRAIDLTTLPSRGKAAHPATKVGSIKLFKIIFNYDIASHRFTL